MEGIEHSTVHVNGINMHVAEKGGGEGPVVLFLHGFPEIWYTWRHQITAFAALGYRAVAPDLRGYGDSDAPESAGSYNCLHVVGDIVGLMDSLAADQVYLVAHDWGAMIGWYLCLFRPDKVKAYVSLTVPFRPRHPKMKPVHSMRTFFGNEYYMCRFQHDIIVTVGAALTWFIMVMVKAQDWYKRTARHGEPGKIEAEIAKYGTKKVLKKILTDRKPGPPCLPKENPFGISPKSTTALPSWLSEADLDYYTNKFDHKGFTGGLNYYRALDLNWELTAPWDGMQVKVPVKFIVGDLDMVYTSPGMKEYVHGGGFKRDVPLLEETVVMEGVGHFINQERAEDVNTHIHDFFKKF